MKTSTRCLLYALVVSWIPLSTFAQNADVPPQPETIEGAMTHVFKSTDQGELRLHVFSPSDQVEADRRAAVVFFFGVNWLKIGPYAWLGQLDGSNLATSLVPAPLAPVGIALGAWLHHRINEVVFFRIVYASLVVLGIKLIYDGLVVRP